VNTDKPRRVRWAYGAFVGYGYYPLLAAVWLLGAALVAFILVAGNAGLFLPTDITSAAPAGADSSSVTLNGSTDCDELAPDYACFQPTLYALDVMLPASAAGQSEAWAPSHSTWLSAAIVVLKSVVWIMTVLLLAGVTGLLRKT